MYLASIQAPRRGHVLDCRHILERRRRRRERARLVKRELGDETRGRRGECRCRCGRDSTGCAKEEEEGFGEHGGLSQEQRRGTRCEGTRGWWSRKFEMEMQWNDPRKIRGRSGLGQRPRRSCLLLAERIRSVEPAVGRERLVGTNRGLSKSPRVAPHTPRRACLHDAEGRNVGAEIILSWLSHSEQKGMVTTVRGAKPRISKG